MQLHFFEEFPTEKNLERLKRIDFDTVVYLAASSVSEFKKIGRQVRDINPLVKPAYWPILPRSYWISPFSFAQELIELSQDLAAGPGDLHFVNEEGPPRLLLDLELPLLAPKLFVRNALHFAHNKRKIREILARAGHPWRIVTAEYPTAYPVFQSLLRLLGVSYSLKRYDHERIVMFYTSMLRNHGPLGEFLVRRLKKVIARRVQHLGSAFLVGLGTIAPGIWGDEPILSPDELERDLGFCREQGVATVVVFRSGGLDTDYLSRLRRFV